jgi:hypothetical protein
MSYWIETKDGSGIRKEIPPPKIIRVLTLHDIVVKSILDQLKCKPADFAYHTFDLTLVGDKGIANIIAIEKIAKCFSLKKYTIDLQYKNPKKDHDCHHPNDGRHGANCRATLWVRRPILIG